MSHRQWDWEEAKRRNAANAEWLKTIFDKPITEEEFIKQWLALPNHAERSSRTKPAKLYRYLKNRFGFFV